MAKSDDENFKPDWDEWSKINRNKFPKATIRNITDPVYNAVLAMVSPLS